MADQREPALPTACRSREGLCPAQAASRSPKRRGEPLDIAQELQNPETQALDRGGGGRGGGEMMLLCRSYKDARCVSTGAETTWHWQEKKPTPTGEIPEGPAWGHGGGTPGRAGRGWCPREVQSFPTQGVTGAQDKPVPSPLQDRLLLFPPSLASLSRNPNTTSPEHRRISPHTPPTSPLLLPVPTRLSASHRSNEFCPASEPCTMPRLHPSAATRASKRGQRSFAASHRSGGVAERRREEKSMRAKLNHLHRHLITD